MDQNTSSHARIVKMTIVPFYVFKSEILHENVSSQIMTVMSQGWNLTPQKLKEEVEMSDPASISH